LERFADGEIALKEKYPRLYSNTILKKGTLCDFSISKDEWWQWSIPWRKEWFQWEKSIVTKLEKELEMINLCRGKWVWKDDETQEYIVQSTYKNKLQKSCSGWV